MTTTGPGPSHRELQELLGAYALDALDPDTTAEVERHLENCVRCSAEVAHHHEVAGLLANSGGESPPHIWDAIAARLEGSGPPSWERIAARLGSDGDAAAPGGPGRLGATGRPGPSTGEGAGRRRARWVTAGAVVVAAAAAVVAVALGIRVDHLDHQVSALTSTSELTAAERALLAQSSTSKVDLTAPAGSGSRVTVLLVLAPSGTGFVQAHRLPALPADRTYQLWAVVGGQTISLGLLGPDPAVVPFSVAGSPPVRAFAITDEQGGGVVQTAQQPVVAGKVRT